MWWWCCLFVCDWFCGDGVLWWWQEEGEGQGNRLRQLVVGPIAMQPPAHEEEGGGPAGGLQGRGVVAGRKEAGTGARAVVEFSHETQGTGG